MVRNSSKSGPSLSFLLKESVAEQTQVRERKVGGERGSKHAKVKRDESKKAGCCEPYIGLRLGRDAENYSRFYSLGRIGARKTTAVTLFQLWQ